MQSSERLQLGEKPAFSLKNALFIDRRDIILALDESDDSGIRQSGDVEMEPGYLSSAECELYNKQLFYWQIIRNGPCLFPPDAELFCGFPRYITQLN